MQKVIIGQQRDLKLGIESAGGYITLIIASIGAVLGIINTWHMIDQSRVKIKVVPRKAMPIGNTPKNINFSLDIINVGSTPVTIYEAGFLFIGTKKRAPYITHGDPISDNLPKRLEPRSSLTVYGQEPCRVDGNKIKCAYAKTECGVVSKGKSPALKEVAKRK